MTTPATTAARLPIRFTFAAAITTLADGAPAWQQVLASGAWKHPSYGDMAITPDDLRELKRNFDAGARQFVYADYDHGIARADGSGNAIAAGEVKRLELRNNDTELWALYEPTEPARQKIAAKEYRYTSADFDPSYRDKRTGQVVGKVLRGFALTNTPYIEGMHPLTLGDAARGAPQLFAEFAASPDTPSTTSTENPMKSIAEKLGLKSDASEPEIVAAVVTLQGRIETARTLSDTHTAAIGALGSIRAHVQLGETATVTEIVSSVKTLAEQNAALTQQARETAADTLLAERLRGGFITPAQKDDFRKKLLSETPAVVTATKEILAGLPKVVPVDGGIAVAGEDSAKDYDALLDERAEKIMGDKKVPYANALVLAEQELTTKGITRTSIAAAAGSK